MVKNFNIAEASIMLREYDQLRSDADCFNFNYCFGNKLPKKLIPNLCDKYVVFNSYTAKISISIDFAIVDEFLEFGSCIPDIDKFWNKVATGLNREDMTII